MSFAVDIESLSFTWSKNNSPTLTIPRWQVRTGEQVFLRGQSGSGKSTLLNLLSGVCIANEGRLSVLGNNLASMSSRQRDQFRAQYLGVIFQQFNLLPYMSAKENILLGQWFNKKAHKSSLSKSEERYQYLGETLGLSQKLLSQQASTLSVGQQQRVAVARALISNPQLIIADEPTSALDTEHRDKFIELLLNQCHADNTTLVFVSHDQSLASAFTQQTSMSLLNTIVEPERPVAHHAN